MRLEEVGSRAERTEGAEKEDSLEEQKQCREKGSIEGGRRDPKPGEGERGRLHLNSSFCEHI